MPSLCVVHLVWSPLGISPFENFVTSYKRRKGGIAHDLLVIFNGFHGEHELADYRGLLSGLSYRQLFLDKPIQDIPAYFAAAGSSGHQYLCFLNSYSEPLDDDWLAKMYEHARREDAGVVGATGSCESHYTDLWREAPRSPSRYFLRRFYNDLPLRRKLRRLAADFDAFPNYHVRSNGFMLARKIMLSLKPGALRTKMDCFKFESGKRGLTRQIIGMGLKPLVVGVDGLAYEKEQWFESATFRSGEERNLLIADNHTREYMQTTPQYKSLLARRAWGDAAG